MRAPSWAVLLAAASKAWATASCDSSCASSWKAGVLAEGQELQSSFLQISATWETLTKLNHAEAKKDSVAGHGDLVFNHIAKTAGTFVKAVLEPGILINGTVKILHEVMYLQPEDFANSWTMGVIRNPCDWIVSKWAYMADQVIESGSPCCEKDRPTVHTESPLKDSPEDIQKFRQFVRDFHGDSPVGDQSINFAASFLQDNRTDDILTDARSLHVTPEALALKLDPTDYTPEDIAVVKEELEKFDVHDINCWIRTESVEEDIRNCLTLFEQDTGISVNWTLLNERVAASTHNPSSHAPCQAYYDNETAAYIRQIESFIFDRFDYQSCC